MKKNMILLCLVVISGMLQATSTQKLTPLTPNKKPYVSKSSVIGKDSGYTPVEQTSPYMQ